MAVWSDQGVYWALDYDSTYRVNLIAGESAAIQITKMDTGKNLFYSRLSSVEQ
jgi:hypothetical protein